MERITLLDLVNLDKILTEKYWELKDLRAQNFKTTNNDIYKIPSPKEFVINNLLAKVVRMKVDFGLNE